MLLNMQIIWDVILFPFGGQGISFLLPFPKGRGHPYREEDAIIPPLRRKMEIVERIYRWSEDKEEGSIIMFGLFLFVGVPLPGKDAYTGAPVAQVLGLKRWWAAAPISAGVVFARSILSLLLKTSSKSLLSRSSLLSHPFPSPAE
ncbi:MAG: small multi-drug export protein [Candidatus Hadarchaeales archaeon]